ncbi:MAG: copper homeostasis protein CutC [Candidatus Cryptobacteroides sp.]
MRALLEVCAGSPESVNAAYEGGAERIELCSALGEGGVTPSAGAVSYARKFEGLKVHCLIRPRGGDFLYTAADAAAMIEDVRLMRSLGADGVVIGALLPDGSVDKELCRRLVAEADGMNVTFHRAFDMCRDPFEALETVISLGCSRILTSGLAPSALQGAGMISSLVERAAGRIIIMPGGGVNKDNAREILDRTGVREIHASASSLFGSGMTFRRGDVNMGDSGVDEYASRLTDADKVRDILEAIA